MADISPGLILILGALLIPVLPDRVRPWWTVALALAALGHGLRLEEGAAGQVMVMGVELTTLRLDGLSRSFGLVFLVAAGLGALYQMHVRGWLQHTAAMIYAGSAVGAVYAGDLVTLFLFWEGTAIASVFLIWARGTESAYRAGMRYLVVQVGSGVLLLAGTMIHFATTGSIAFDSFDVNTMAGVLILLAFGIKAAFPLVHTWLTDAYPEATATGTVILSAFTTKLAIYALARGYAGAEILVPIGAAMAAFTVLFAVIANDLRRVLAYGQIAGLGFMVTGIGIGTELAVNGTVVYAVCSLIYLMTLFMAMGTVLHRVGTVQASALGGLYRSMPLTTVFALIAAASMAALPLFSGFVSKSLITSAAGKEGHDIAWAVMMFGTVGLIVAVALKVPYAAFFAGDRGLRPQEGSANMLGAMGLGAALCVAIGVYPAPLYALLPYEVTYNAWKVEHAVAQLQLVVFAVLAFTVLLKAGLYPSQRRGINLDVDWLWRSPLGGLLAGGRDWLAGWWEVIETQWLSAGVKLSKALYRQHGPTGALARTQPSGSIALWMAVLLIAFLVFAFL